jgi:hypothetical protein
VISNQHSQEEAAERGRSEGCKLRVLALDWAVVAGNERLEAGSTYNGVLSMLHSRHRFPTRWPCFARISWH